jgi:xylan 1,4-beta-xylosidase
VGRVLVEEYGIDNQHSNAFEVWKQMGSPQEPSAEQDARLKAAGQLETIDSPRWIPVKDGGVETEIDLPRESVALLRLSWEK